MTSNQPDIADAGLETRLISNLIIELNIARRNFRSYPEGHPVIEASLNKALVAYEKLFSVQREIILGVTRDTLLINDTALDRKNLVFRNFARFLYELGIGALVLHHGLNINELRKFSAILNLKREDVLKHGNIASIWDKSGISAIAIKPVRYDLLGATELNTVSGIDSQPPISLWESFVRGLMQGALSTDSGDSDGILPDMSGDGNDNIAPELLASLLNSYFESIGQAGESVFSDAIDTIDMDPFSQSLLTGAGSSVSCDNLAIFIDKLDPELRRQFKNSDFAAQVLAKAPLIAEATASRFSPEAVARTMNQITHNRYNVPPTIIHLIQTMSRHASDYPISADVEHDEEADMNQRINTVFCEYSSDNYIPQSYQATLDRIVCADLTSSIEKGMLDDLFLTMDSHTLENHISDIILNMMSEMEHDEKQTATLIENMNYFYDYLLETGEYEQIIHLIEQCNSEKIPRTIREQLRRNYTSREYLDEMLADLTTWGKSRYDDITRLIHDIGPPFIEVLLERLAQEENLSLRRFYMERIQEFGAQAKDAIIARLSDNRWYLVRNLAIMLRLLDDRTVLKHVRPLMRHPNQRVRMEALLTCLHLQDPSAERKILHDLESSDRETQMTAIGIAEKSHSPDIFRKLLSLLGSGGLSNLECELKKTVINTLAEIGRPEALPELARLLASRSLLNGNQLNKLKIDIIHSMKHYPADVAQPILQLLARKSSKIGVQAAATLKNMTEKPQ